MMFKSILGGFLVALFFMTQSADATGVIADVPGYHFTIDGQGMVLKGTDGNTDYTCGNPSGFNQNDGAGRPVQILQFSCDTNTIAVLIVYVNEDMAALSVGNSVTNRSYYSKTFSKSLLRSN